MSSRRGSFEEEVEVSIDILGESREITATVEFLVDEGGIAIENLYMTDRTNIIDISWMLDFEIEEKIITYLHDLAEDRLTAYDEDDERDVA